MSRSLTSIPAQERLIVALDFPHWAQAAALVDTLPEVAFYKIGLEMYLSAGETAVKALKDQGKKVFLDLKFHDIPNTVAQACCRALHLGVDILNVHALGGQRMMAEAAAALAHHAQAENLPAPALIAVTILTSMAQTDLQEVGLAGRPTDNVLTLAHLAQAAGLAGVVASPQEIRLIRQAVGEDFLIVCPGIRPADAAQDDQRRTLTPGEAIAAGADYLVVGRPITKAADPQAAAAGILADIQLALTP